jgi:hypothetical protein
MRRERGGEDGSSPPSVPARAASAARRRVEVGPERRWQHAYWNSRRRAAGRYPNTVIFVAPRRCRSPVAPHLRPRCWLLRPRCRRATMAAGSRDRVRPGPVDVLCCRPPPVGAGQARSAPGAPMARSGRAGRGSGGCARPAPRARRPPSLPARPAATVRSGRATRTVSGGSPRRAPPRRAATTGATGSRPRSGAPPPGSADRDRPARTARSRAGPAPPPRPEGAADPRPSAAGRSPSNAPDGPGSPGSEPAARSAVR